MPNRCIFGVGRDLCRLMSVHKAGLYKASEAFEKGFERGLNVMSNAGEKFMKVVCWRMAFPDFGTVLEEIFSVLPNHAGASLRVGLVTLLHENVMKPPRSIVNVVILHEPTARSAARMFFIQLL